MTRPPLFLFPVLVALSLIRASATDRSSVTDPHPGFDGIWNSATATPLERPPRLKDKAFFTPQEAAEWERQVVESNEEPPPDATRKNTAQSTK